jgi:hypothetical protein
VALRFRRCKLNVAVHHMPITPVPGKFDCLRRRPAQPLDFNLACQSWNEKMRTDSGPVDPSLTIDQAINGG